MKLDHLLRDQYFILQTDSKILSHMNTDHKDKVKRWKIAIQHFNFDVLHIEGKQNIEADALSRLSNLRNDIRTASPVYRYMRKNRYLNLSLTF